MELRKIEQPVGKYTGLNTGELTTDFKQKIISFTKNLSAPQLQLLRDHVDHLSSYLPAIEPLSPSLLSKRETEVLILLTNGYNRRDIGSSLGISANTAARHIANIYQKLNISCVAEATHYAISHRIIS